MKFFIILTVAVAMVNASPSASLKQDLQDIADRFPLEKIRAITAKYLNEDAQMYDIVNYLQNSNELSSIVTRIQSNQSWKSFKAYMLEQGLDIEHFFAVAKNVIVDTKTAEVRPASGKITNYIEEVLEAVDLKGIQEFVEQKIKSSSEFERFYSMVTSQKAKGLVDDARAVCAVEDIIVRLRKMDLDLVTFTRAAYGLVGWEFDAIERCN